jgi:excisionase family DNA binding protein
VSGSRVEVYLTPRDVADRLRVPVRHVIKLVRGGEISRGVRLGYRTYRVPESAVAAYLRGRACGG